MTGVQAKQIASAAQAKMLLDPRLNPLLSELARQGEASAAELARRLGRALSSVHAQLERLLAARVIEVAERSARAGRPVRRYRLPLPWHIPFEVTPAATLRELLGGRFEVSLREQLDHLARVMNEAEGTWEVVMDWQKDQLEESIRPLRRSEARRLGAVVGAGTVLRLSPERARELKARLQGLVDEFLAQPDEAGERWNLTVLFTPGEPF